MAQNIIGDALDGLVSVTKFAPDRFRGSVMNQFGLASPSRFEVIFPDIRDMKTVGGESIRDPSNTEDRHIFCTAAGMPGKNVTSTNKGIGIENQMIVNGHQMPEVSFSFYLTNTYTMRDYFEEWMRCITSQNPEQTQFVGYYDNYVKDVKVIQYTRNARKAYTVELIDAYPTNIGTIEFNNQLQTAVAEVTITMTYRTYKTRDEKESIGDIIGDIFG